MTFSRNLAITLATLCLLAPCASADPINYAQGKPATASGLYPYGGPFAIEFGNDGDPNTRWNGGTGDAWWQVDLKAIVTIDDIVVFNQNTPGGYHTTFQLSSSTNGSTWSTVGAQTTGSGISVYSFTFHTTGAEMRYIRYTTISESGSDWGAIGELQAFGPDQGKVQAPEPATLVLLGACLTALGLARRFRHQ